MLNAQDVSVAYEAIMAAILSFSNMSQVGRARKDTFEGCSISRLRAC
jgi:hypothetical protein